MQQLFEVFLVHLLALHLVQLGLLDDNVQEHQVPPERDVLAVYLSQTLYFGFLAWNVGFQETLEHPALELCLAGGVQLQPFLLAFEYFFVLGRDERNPEVVADSLAHSDVARQDCVAQVDHGAPGPPVLLA